MTEGSHQDPQRKSGVEGRVWPEAPGGSSSLCPSADVALQQGVRLLSAGSGGRTHGKARASGVLPWRRSPSQAERHTLGQRRKELGLCGSEKAHKLGVRMARASITGHSPVPGTVPGTWPVQRCQNPALTQRAFCSIDHCPPDRSQTRVPEGVGRGS